MNHKLLLITLSLLFVAAVFTSTAYATVIQTDKTGTVTSVIDGSTFTISTGETIKLAEIETPSSGEAGFESSRSYLASMIQGKTILLDVDTLIVSDQGNFLCVAYLDYNTTHYENINKAMLENRYAAPTSTTTTEFNPSTWTWFVSKETATPTPTAVPTVTASPSPSPTPFSGPTPSVTPDISQPTATATPTQATTPPENTSPEMQTWIIIVAVAVVAAVIVIALILKKRK